MVYDNTKSEFAYQRARIVNIYSLQFFEYNPTVRLLDNYVISLKAL